MIPWPSKLQLIIFFRTQWLPLFIHLINQSSFILLDESKLLFDSDLYMGTEY